MLNATNSPIEVRAAEAIRYALEYKLGEWGTLYATRAGQPNLIVADISITTGNVPEVGDSIWVGDTSHEVTAITYSLSLPAGYRITTADAVTAEAGVPVRLDKSLYVRRSDDTRTREGLPWLCVVQVSNLMETWPGAENWRGQLMIGLDSEANLLAASQSEALDNAERVANLAAHNQRAAQISAALMDVPSIGVLVHAEPAGVYDFTLVALLTETQPGGNTDAGSFTWFMTKTIVCESVSYWAI